MPACRAPAATSVSACGAPDEVAVHAVSTTVARVLADTTVERAAAISLATGDDAAADPATDAVPDDNR